MLERRGRASRTHVIAMLLWLSGHAFAQGLTGPVTVGRVGPEGGIVYSIVVDPSDSDNVFCVSETGVFKSTDRGATWSYSGLVGTSVSTIAIVPQSPGTVYAGAPGNIFKSLDAGATWNLVSGTPPNLFLLGIDAQGTLFGRIRPIGGLFKSSDEGTTWQPASVGLPVAIGPGLGPLAIDARTNTLYIAGYVSPSLMSFVTVFKSTNEGDSWSPITSATSDNGAGLTVDPGNANTLYLTTSTGFLKSRDGGKSWITINNGLPECFCTFSPVVIDPQRTDTLYAIRYDGSIFKSTNGGQNWAINSSFATVSLTIDPRDSNTLYAARFGSRYFGFGAFKSTDGGVSWSEINTNLRATPIVSAVIDPQSPETFYAATFRFSVLKSSDKGHTWAPSGSGIQLTDAFNVTSVVALAIDPQTPNILYAGAGGGDECDSGRVSKTIDAGANWAPAGKVDCLVALVIDPRIPSTIYALTEFDGGVLKSIDGGGSFNPINAGLPKGSVKDLAIDPQNSQILYAAVGKTVYKSRDGGASWNYSTELSAAIIQITTDGQHPGTVYAIVAPSAGGIWKSVDGGTTWQDLSAALPALPNTIALDLKNSATIYAATDYGVITSADGGRSWTLLTAAIGFGIQRLIPGSDSTLYASGPAGLFAISSSTVSAVTFDIGTVQTGASYTATIVGSNLNDNTYFDVLVRAPGSTENIVVLNWQMGTSESHSVPAGVFAGTWTIDGVRAHQDPDDHTGSFAPVSAATTVINPVQEY